MGRNELTAILRDAMEAERDGFTFYRAAAERADDPGARGTFARLADEERAHFDALQSGYKALLAGEAWDPPGEAGSGGMPEITTRTLPARCLPTHR